MTVTYSLIILFKTIRLMYKISKIIKTQTNMEKICTKSSKLDISLAFLSSQLNQSQLFDHRSGQFK